MPEISLPELLKNGVHFGHQESRWHPKMKPYIFAARNGVHIINLEKTAEKLKEALDFLREIVTLGGVVLLVGTKRQAKEIVRKYAMEVKMPFITERWIGGTLTNFSVISRLIDKFKKLKKEKESGELQKYTKKEQLKFDQEIERLNKLVGGVESLGRLPQALFVIDVKHEKTAVREAKRMKIPLVALVDTNSNPSDVDYVIPGNDDATKSVEYMTGLIAESIKEGLAQREKKLNDKKDVNDKSKK